MRLLLDNPQDILEALFDSENAPVQFKKGGFPEGRISTHHASIEPHKRDEKEGDDESEFSTSGSQDRYHSAGLLTLYRSTEITKELIA